MNEPRSGIILAGREARSAGDILRALEHLDFPFDELALHRVSAIEHVAVKTSGLPRGMCAVGCLACCAGAAPPSVPAHRIARLSPELLTRILSVAEELAKRGTHILSTIRLVLYNGSNELDNPDCIPLRKILSAFLERTYGFPLGSVSSDLAFHLSGSAVLERNLEQLLRRPTLWDNICVSIDEQIPIRGEVEYLEYLEKLRAIWTLLKPALECRLDHATESRLGEPRVIINMLVPRDGAEFRHEHQFLYPGGPPRAMRFEELIARYINPFVGTPIDTTAGLPQGHKFTSGTARLSKVPGSSVYVGYNRYMPTGRGSSFLRPTGETVQLSASAINTKIYPAGEDCFRFKACFTTAPYADDEIVVSADRQPVWFGRLNNLLIDVEQLPTGPLLR